MALNEDSNWTPTEQIILERRSVRLYQEKQVPEQLIKRILEAGRFAPSAGNCQPWKFVVLRDPQVLGMLSEATIAVCKNLTSVLGGGKPSEPVHPVPLSTMHLIAQRKLGVFHGAPTAILIFKDVRGVSNPNLDCGIAGQNMVIAAQGLGLATCWVSFVGLAFQYVPDIAAQLGIGYPFEYASSIVVGYPKGRPLGMVERETHAVDWYENGTKKVIY